MRIVIEIDGTPVVATEAPTPVSQPQVVSHLSAEPPAELARAARAIGAESAGPAAFFRPALAEFRAPTLETAGRAAGKTPATSLDAGSAAAISGSPAKTSAPVGKRPKKRR